jgi:UDP-glucose 4-epimerase
MPASTKGRVLLTGGSGFVASHLGPWLRDRGYDVQFLVRTKLGGATIRQHVVSFQDVAALESSFASLQPDFVIHLAALAQPGREVDAIASQMENTVLPSINVAKAVPTNIKLLLSFGSCEEYGNGPTPFLENQKSVCFSPYGWGKISAHYATTLVADSRGVPWSWARPFLLFGPGQKSKQLVPTLIEGCLADKTIPLTAGEQTRDFIYIDDLCARITAILENPKNAVRETFNLASGIARSIREVATTIRDTVGKGNLDFGALPYRAQEAMSFYASTKKFDNRFGRLPTTPFVDAISTTVNAYAAAGIKNAA